MPFVAKKRVFSVPTPRFPCRPGSGMGPRARVQEAEGGPRWAGERGPRFSQAERDQLRVLQEQLVELGKEEDSVRMQRDLLAKQQEQLRTQLGEQKGRLQVLQSQVARRSDVDSELAVRKVELQESTETARRARAAADSTAARAKQLRDERARNASKYRHDLDTQDAQIRNLQREVDALTELAKSIEVMQGRVENAEVLKAKLAIADDSVRSAERELEGLRARLEAAEEKRQKKEAIREALQANIRLKSIEEEVERHQQEISSLLKDLGGRDIEALRKQLSNVRTRAMELQKQRSFREGELVQTREAIRSLEVELASPLYAGPMKICRVLWKFVNNFARLARLDT